MASPENRVCSPIGNTNDRAHKTCFPLATLKDLTRRWNAFNALYPEKQIASTHFKTHMDYWNALNDKMKARCQSDLTKEGCWVQHLNVKEAGVLKFVKPTKPKEWTSKPRTWLTNLDIEDVMEQYAQDKTFRYNFLGVFPIDFALKDDFGACVVSEICHLSWRKLASGGAKFMGMITNLDNHNQSGSHWTSVFACLDPSYPCFGVYYYDSGRSEPPPEMRKFMEDLRALVVEHHGSSSGKKFKIEWNHMKQHQFKNTECGVFAMMYQMRWLDLLKKDKGTLFETVVGVNWNDEHAFYKRNELYAQNFNGGHKRNKKNNSSV